MKLSHLLENIDVMQISGDCSREVPSVCYDSHRCDRDSLFVAIPGLMRDGHDYIADALKRGAAFIIHERDFAPPAGVCSIRVADSRRALGILGRNFYRNPSAEICLAGVTGTNGKTTVTYLLEAIFKAAGFQPGVLGTINYRYQGGEIPAPNTTPESYEFQRILREMADNGVTHVVAEVSSHALSLKRVDDCDFDLGIFTNLSQDHLDYHHTIEEYFQAKLRFFEEILPESGKRKQTMMIVNGDDPWGRKIFAKGSVPGMSFGMSGERDVWGEILALGASGSEAIIHHPRGRFPITTPLVGRFNFYNVLAAAAAGLALEIPEAVIQQGIADLAGVPGRLERVSRKNEATVFVDYAHTPDALLRVLQNLMELRRGRIITVFGCGGDRDRGKRPLMGEAAVAYSDVTIVTSDNPRSEDPLTIMREIEKGMDSGSACLVSPEKILVSDRKTCYTLVPDRRQAIELAVALGGLDDTILIAGKGHEGYQIIGDKRLPFDDRREARKALDARAKKI